MCVTIVTPFNSIRDSTCTTVPDQEAGVVAEKSRSVNGIANRFLCALMVHPIKIVCGYAPKILFLPTSSWAV